MNENKTPEEIVNDYFAVVGELAKLGAELIKEEADLDYKSLDVAIQKAEESYKHLKKLEKEKAIESFKESHENLMNFYRKVHEKTPKKLISREMWAFAMHGAEFYLERKLPEGYDPEKIFDRGLESANEVFTDELKCILGIKPSETVRYVTDKLAKLIDECNQDPAYQHPFRDDPEFRFKGFDAIRKGSDWGKFSNGYGYLWRVSYEAGKGASSNLIHMEYDPRTKVFRLNFEHETKDPDKAVELYTKEVEKIAEGRK
ncbi:hypothetical protein KY343_04295 [Candidatus Woesearchaeota archaeon]|nr:hypothetical protein [Candidatus Woesearchaeota archaeon]